MIRVKEIKIPIENYNDKILKQTVAKKIKCKLEDIKELKINKQSIDARHKPNIFYITEVDINVKNENVILKQNKNI